MATNEATGSSSFWTTLPGLLTGLAALITAIGGVYVSIIRPATDHAASEAPPSEEQEEPTAVDSSDPTSEPRRLDANGVSVSASSELLPQASFHYTAGNVLDGDPGTAWAEGVDGAGVGESLDFAFSDNVQLVGIEILNGYNRTAETFSSNGRVRLMRITTKHEDDIVNLDDSMTFQTVDGDLDGRTPCG